MSFNSNFLAEFQSKFLLEGILATFSLISNNPLKICKGNENSVIINDYHTLHSYLSLSRFNNSDTMILPVLKHQYLSHSK